MTAQEIATLRKEAQAFKAVRDALRSPTTTGDAARMVFQKVSITFSLPNSTQKSPFDLCFSLKQVFNSDIRNLLSMADMWRSRAPPLPLDFDAIRIGTFILREEPPAQTNVAPNGSPKGKANGMTNNVASGSKGVEKLLNGANGANGSAPTAAGLKDQRSLTLGDNLALFVSRYVISLAGFKSMDLFFVSSTDRLAARLRAGEDTISFDKDDDDTLDFVTAAANLRSFAYTIERKTRWEVKG